MQATYCFTNVIHRIFNNYIFTELASIKTTSRFKYTRYTAVPRGSTIHQRIRNY